MKQKNVIRGKKKLRKRKNNDNNRNPNKRIKTREGNYEKRKIITNKMKTTRLNRSEKENEQNKTLKSTQ